MSKPSRIELLNTRIAGLRAALATDAELLTMRQYGTPDQMRRAEALNDSLLAAIAGYEAELAELVAVQDDPLATAWLEYRQARQAYAEATRPSGGFSTEPKHPREVVRAADQRLAEAYMRVDEEICRLHTIRKSAKGPGLNFPLVEFRIVIDKENGGRFIHVEDVDGNLIRRQLDLRQRPDGFLELRVCVPVIKKSSPPGTN